MLKLSPSRPLAYAKPNVLDLSLASGLLIVPISTTLASALLTSDCSKIFIVPALPDIALPVAILVSLSSVLAKVARSIKAAIVALVSLDSTLAKVA